MLKRYVSKDYWKYLPPLKYQESDGFIHINIESNIYDDYVAYSCVALLYVKIYEVYLFCHSQNVIVYISHNT